MIRIEVEDYCQECLDFNPDVHVINTRGTNPETLEEFQHVDTIVKCKYRKRCANIRRYLERQVKGETV